MSRDRDFIDDQQFAMGVLDQPPSGSSKTYRTDGLPNTVGEMKAFRVSSLSLAVERRRFAMTFV